MRFELVHTYNGNLHPLLKAETLKNGSVTFLKTGLGPISFKFKKGLFTYVFEERFDFQTEFEEILQARAQEAQARGWDPGPNVFWFKLSLKMDLNNMTQNHFSKCLEKIPRPIFKLVTDPCVQSSFVL